MTRNNPPPDPIADLTRQVALLSTQVEAMRKQLHDTPSSPSSQSTAESATRPRMKLDVPLFDGSDAHGWIFKISQFFTYHHTPEEDRITIASFYLDGPALAWYQWMHRNQQIVSWTQFLTALETRFAPTAYDDPRGKLFKLTQSTTVAAYLTEFEALANRLEGLSPSDLLSCFISGLKTEIRREILALRPSSLSQAAGLARLQEEKQQDVLRSSRSRPWQPPPKSSLETPATTKTTSGLLPTPPGKPRFRHLSGPEMDERREKGLCFNCDQRWSRNHKCGARIFLMLSNDDNDVVTGDLDSAAEQIVSSEIEPITEAAQLSLHALSGDQAGDTFRVKGLIGSHSVGVLVDGGSTHNFIRSSIADGLGLSRAPITSFRVLVGSGQELLCSHVCREVIVLIQGHKFCLDLFILDLRGTDLVLGAQWLKRIGPVLMNYSTLTLTFFHDNSTVELHGDTSPHTIGLHSFHKLTRFEPEAQLFSLHVSSPDSNLTHTTSIISPQPNHTFTNCTTLEPKLQSLLTQYSHLFSEPSSLPPPRATDHTIPLVPHASPVKVRPYRYPHSQKQEIETQVAKLINTGWIQPSTSPFSSPVLLLKKKDGSWRMCVDYRALNAITVRDRFPLPTIDELLDELGRARVFSKLDLTSGFHQIRVAPEDVHKTAFRTHDGHYEYRVMPFGLCNAPSTFQATMNEVFRSLLRKTVIVFFDDILVFSTSMAEHYGHLSQVFSILDTHQFHLKPSKCSFGQRQIAYLGHIVSDGTVAPDPSKIQGVIDWPTPKSTKSLRGFLGLSGFYRRFVKGYANLAHPLTSLLKKNSFEWSDSAQEAFEALKLALSSAPILSLPDFTFPLLYNLMLLVMLWVLCCCRIITLSLTLVSCFALGCLRHLLI